MEISNTEKRKSRVPEIKMKIRYIEKREIENSKSREIDKLLTEKSKISEN